jgi:hypothetical protein
MMICPKCGAEYRRGFTSCSDCHVLLVEQGTEAAEKLRAAWSTPVSDPPEDREEERSDGGAAFDERLSVGEESPRGNAGDPNTDPFCSFWKGTDLRVCTEVCTVLDEAGIPHKTIRRQDHLFHLNSQASYQVGVPASLYEKAEHAIRDAFGPEGDGNEDAVKLLPAPEKDSKTGVLRTVWTCENMMVCKWMCEKLKAADIPYQVNDTRRHLTSEEFEEHYEIEVDETDYDRAIAITGGVPAVEENEEPMEVVFAAQDSGEPGSRWIDDDSRKIRSGFYPEDATSLAWEGDPVSWREAVEMSLKELDIPMRWEAETGKERVYVLPEDEARAKEIVQEVITGQPSGDQESREST